MTFVNLPKKITPRHHRFSIHHPAHVMKFTKISARAPTGFSYFT
ncbi:Uncharacterized protein APZ42_013416 [Daphnia magna]|uniref:Uncharacterized protein n=1 Tax=Daphnia magna TaxID=35525 RepID=A0A162QYW2_9CRUS|nr:Uncharacterized protein APZ42_013416 [Daphnia magna]